MNGLTKKKIASCVLTGLGIDVLFRHINKNKLLVIMYHGVTSNTYHPPIWTHLPFETFKSQLLFLKRFYNLISMQQLLDGLCGITKLPQRAALITFDDGYKNNFELAFPVLRELNIPATIFITVDKIGTKNLLWVDEIYLLFHSELGKKTPLPFINELASCLFQSGRTWESYCETVEKLKISSEKFREEYMTKLKNCYNNNSYQNNDDFTLLNWDQIIEMYNSGLISFGVHTASHKILSELENTEWDYEIKAPKKKLEERLGSPITTFCFPNGRPKIDFSETHISYLKECEYQCSFTTKATLHNLEVDNCMEIGRIAAGNDITSYFPFFKLNTSGFITFARKFFNP